MKKEFGLVLIALFFLSLNNTFTAVYALDKDGKEVVLIEEKADISGDGKEDTIFLKGIPYEEGASYLKEIFLQITGSNGKSERVELEGGYEPGVTFVDLNHDDIEDMLISIPSGGSGGMTNYSLFTYKDFQLKEIAPPDPLTITSQFLDQYQAKITIENTGQSYNFDLKSRKNDYDRLGIYQNGKLNEPRELMVDPYSTLKPVKINDNSYGLKAIQQISGAYHADGIAFIESTWNYENGKWLLLDTKVMERKQRVKR
ncbi:hypothetical protein [Bacillus benzoevorans]|uniref:VCBS repeat-containing protein n=1 Tax=Bacillus benzoevorans TaxID=1456 RepID=A0A7X0LYG0_9BACI|nr:hypothetical protein [Bacillus benzoevorans]MBB6447404.1 hypothetical protein [Bacillus benzoevorans]